jgi:NAD(P)H-flavin reductase
MAPADARLAAPRTTDPFVPELYRVEAVRRELTDTVTLELTPVSGPRPAFEAGQFNMLYAFGVGEVAISISGSPDPGNRFIHTVRDVGAVSGAIARCQPGDVLGLRGPFGIGWPVKAAEGADVLFVAGGLGLAPLRPAIYQVLGNRARYKQVAILFGTRNPADMLFRKELESWRQRLDIEVEVTVDHADAEWHGHVGVVPGLIAHVPFDPAKAIAFVCGPEVMMRFTATALTAAGVAGDRIYLSMERNMKCAIGLCGHCQFGPGFVCKDGPVMPYNRIAGILALREI